MNPRVPAEEFPFRHSYPVQIRFNDIDVVGHLNNSIYFSFLDLGKMQYFNEIMKDRITWKQVPVVIVNINIDFYSQTFIDERLEVLTQTVRLSDRSLTLEQRIVNPVTGDVKCVARTVMAGFDVSTGKSAPIPEEWKQAVRNFEGRNI